MAISKERKDQIIKEFATHEGDTGSTQVQVAVLTADINELNDHLRTHKHDYHSQRGLMKKIGHRRNLLAYLRRTDLNAYRDLIQKLGLRWCHTFSPSKMWINGFVNLQKTYCHFATQYNREIPPKRSTWIS